MEKLLNFFFLKIYFSLSPKKKNSDDDRLGRRDRYSGAMQEFREKDGYNPDFKLDYVDEKGRMMNQKEAFRYLSHKFHGKGPGKNKIDKRMKKMEQESVCLYLMNFIKSNEMKLIDDEKNFHFFSFFVYTEITSNELNRYTIEYGKITTR